MHVHVLFDDLLFVVMQSYEAIRWALDRLNKEGEELNGEYLSDTYIPGVKLGKLHNYMCHTCIYSHKCQGSCNLHILNMSHLMTKPTKWHVCPVDSDQPGHLPSLGLVASKVVRHFFAV